MHYRRKREREREGGKDLSKSRENPESIVVRKKSERSKMRRAASDRERGTTGSENTGTVSRGSFSSISIRVAVFIEHERTVDDSIFPNGGRFKELGAGREYITFRVVPCRIDFRHDDDNYDDDDQDVECILRKCNNPTATCVQRVSRKRIFHWLRHSVISQ